MDNNPESGIVIKITEDSILNLPEEHLGKATGYEDRQNSTPEDGWTAEVNNLNEHMKKHAK